MNKNRIMNHESRIKGNGFTLLELLIVISIIGILVAVGLASYSSAQVKARDSRRLQDMKTVQTAMEQYFAENNAYPTNVAAANCNGGTCVASGTCTDFRYAAGDIDCTIPLQPDCCMPADPAGSCNPGSTFLPIGLPIDPKPSLDYEYGCDGDTYFACAQLEGTGKGNADDTHAFVANGDYFCVKNLQ